MVTVKQLQAFMAVVDGGNFQAAARRLNTSQPAISRRITELESALMVRLFDRTTRTCTLTPRGRLLVAHATNVMRDLSLAVATVGEQSGVTGLLRLGVVETIALTKLPAMVGRLAADFPGIAVEVEVDVTSALMRRLQSRDIDLCVIVAPVTENGVVSEVLWDMDLAWFGPSERFAAGQSLSVEELARESVLIHTRSRHGNAVQKWFLDAGVQPERTIRCSSLAGVLRMMASGIGIGLVPRAAVESWPAAVALVQVKTTIPLPRNPFVMACLADHCEPATQACQQAFRAAAMQPDLALGADTPSWQAVRIDCGA